MRFFNDHIFRKIAIFAALLSLFGGVVYAQIEGNSRGVASVRSTGDFEVSGIEVNVRGKNADAARFAGWKEAQRKAWVRIWRKSRRGAAVPALSDAALNNIVSAIVVEEEQIGPRRYIAKLGVMFDRVRAGPILGIKGRLRRSVPIVLIPVMWSGGSPQVFESRTEWQKAWARFPAGDSNIDYVRPSGAGADALLLNAAQTGRRNRAWWRTILEQYNAADILTPVVHLNREWPGGPVTAKFAARFGPDNRLISGFSLRAQNSAGLENMLDEGVKRLDRIYSRALSTGVLKPDTSLVIEEPIELEDIPLDEDEREGAQDTAAANSASASPAATPVAASSTNTIMVQFMTPDVASVNQGEASVRSVPGVASASTGSLALGGTSVMRVVYSGNMAELSSALAARGWTVQQGVGAIRISRRGAQ